MSAREKSDLPKVAEKRANKVASAAAELAERRGGAKENAELQSTVRTQSRAAVSQAQSRIRETGQANGALASSHRRCFAGELLRAEEVRRARRRRDDMDRVRERPRGEPRGSPFSRPNRSVSSAAIASDLYSEAGWQAATARHRCPGGQDRPGGGGGNPDADL